MHNVPLIVGTVGLLALALIVMVMLRVLGGNDAGNAPPAAQQQEQSAPAADKDLPLNR